MEKGYGEQKGGVFSLLNGGRGATLP
jgi:hypothetical protein